MHAKKDTRYGQEHFKLDVPEHQTTEQRLARYSAALVFDLCPFPRSLETRLKDIVSTTAPSASLLNPFF